MGPVRRSKSVIDIDISEFCERLAELFHVFRLRFDLLTSLVDTLELWNITPIGFEMVTYVHSGKSAILTHFAFFFQVKAQVLQ